MGQRFYSRYKRFFIFLSQRVLTFLKKISLTFITSMHLAFGVLVVIFLSELDQRTLMTV